MELFINLVNVREHNSFYLSAGMYTVMVAQMKRRVVAVDPIRDNLALISSSVNKAGTQEYVQFVASPIR